MLKAAVGQRSVMTGSGLVAAARSLLLSAALFAVSLAIRLPDLTLIPRYSDEGFEVLQGLDIALGRALPLTGVSPYYGPLFAYLMAALFRLFGVHPEAPRLVAATFGALTVVAVYWLGRLVYSHVAGLVAAVLTAASPSLVVYTSHHGWANSLTPCLVVAMLAALSAGATRRDARLLAASGLLAALALQTHPTVAPALIGAALWTLSRLGLRSTLKEPGVYAALGLFALGYAPVIVANVRPGSPVAGLAVDGASPFTPTLQPDVYLQRVTVFAKDWLLTSGGQMVGAGLPSPWAARALILALGLLTVLGLAWSWRQGARLMPIVFVTSGLLLPLFVDPVNYRYFAYMLPLAYLATGSVVTAMSMDHPAAGPVARSLALVWLAAQVVFAVLTMSAYRQQMVAEGKTNAEYTRLVDTIRARGACGPGLIVEDYPLNLSDPVATQAWYALHAIDYVLTLADCPHTVLPQRTVRQQMSSQGSPIWLITPEAGRAAYAPYLTLPPAAVFFPAPIDATVVPVGLFQRVAP